MNGHQLKNLKRLDDVLDETAVHEAGHAVVAVGLDLRIEQVSMMRTEEHLALILREEAGEPVGHEVLAGRVRWRFGHCGDAPSPWASVALALAGHAAVHVRGGEDLRELLDHRWSDAIGDLDHAEDEAHLVYSSRARARRGIVQSWDRVCCWLRELASWSCTDEIADRLLERDLDGSEIYTIAERHSVRTGDSRLVLVAELSAFEALSWRA